jgi:hypothetical protein
VNIDKQAACGPDLVLDLEHVPWPFDDGSIDEVFACHVLEHLGQSPEVFLGIMRELYRVMKTGATARIIVPHPRSDDFLTDPTHVRPITDRTLQMFSKARNRETLALGSADTPLGIYLDIDFEIASLTFELRPEFKTRLNKGKSAEDKRELERLMRECNNVVRQIDITIRKI